MTNQPGAHGIQDSAGPGGEIGDTTRSRVTIPAYDYADKFVLATADAEAIGTPAEWARAALRDAAGIKGQIVWRGLLGLRLKDAAAPGQIAGWAVAGRGDGWVTLAADSWLIDGNLVLEVSSGGVSLSTFVHFRRRIGAAVWNRAAPGHRRFAPTLLPEARRILLAHS
ncbi:hypothetical protein [Nocardia sp. NPDC003345]